MITLPSLHDIDQYIPAIPQLADLPQVIHEVQAPMDLVHSGTELATDTATALGVVAQAGPPTTRAALDITRVVSAGVATAMAIAPGLLNPITAPMAAGKIQQVLSDAAATCMRILEELRMELSPLARRLDEIAAKTPTSREPAPLSLPGTPTSIAEGSPEEPVSLMPAAHTPTAPGNDAQQTDGTTGATAVMAAKNALGVPYVWGGTSMNGFDCSGLTQWAYRQAGVELPRLAEHQNVGQQVSQDQLQPGDLLVWDGHVAMYAGDGEIIEAGNPVQMGPVRTTNMGMTFKGFFRPY